MKENQHLIISGIFIFFLLFTFHSAKSQWQYLGSPEACSSIDFDSEGDTLVLLTTGGLFFSKDTGAIWHQIVIPQGGNKLEQIQIENGSLYLTSLRRVIINDDERTKYDVFRSDNWGATWHLLTENMDPLDGFIQVLIQSDTFYYIDRAAIHVSYDKGDHYSLVTENLGFYSSYYIHHSRLFGEINSDVNTAIARSDDDGQTWDTLFNSTSGFYVSDINSIDGELWKIEHYPEGHLCRVTKSLDDGQTWVITGTIYNLQVGSFDNDPRKIIGRTGQLYMMADGYYMAIYNSSDGGQTWQKTASLHSSNSVFFSHGELFFTGDSFHASKNHGESLEKISTGLNAGIVRNIAVSSSSIWVQANYAEFALSEEMLEWQSLDSFEDVESTRNGALLAYKGQMAYRSSNQGLDWIPITDQDLGQTFPAGVHHIMCAGDMMYLSDNFYNLYYSTNDGATWHSSNVTYGYNFNYNGKYLINPGEDILSSDNGYHWELLPKPEHPDLHFFINCVYWVDPFYFVGSGNLLLRLHKDSTIWEKVEIPYPGVQGFPISMSSKDNILIISICGRGVFTSLDYGQTWESFNAGLMNTRTITLTKDESNLYLGVDGGVWKRPLDELVVSTSSPEYTHHPYSTTLLTNDQVTIDMRESLNTHQTFQLCSADGRILLHEKVAQKQVEIDLGDYFSGLYFLIIQSTSDQQVYRVVKF